MKKTVFILNVIVGFFLILGTAGRADLNLISFKMMFLQSALGLWLLVTGAIGLKSLDPEF